MRFIARWVDRWRARDSVSPDDLKVDRAPTKALIDADINKLDAAANTEQKEERKVAHA